MAKQSFEFAGALNLVEAATYLEELARSLRSGQVSLDAGEDHFELHCSEDLALEIDARSSADGAKATIEVRLLWRRSRRKQSDQSLLINSGATPAAQAVEPPSMSQEQSVAEETPSVLQELPKPDWPPAAGPEQPGQHDSDV